MERLQKYLKTNGMRQVELARRLGLSNGYLHNLLRGNRRPSLDMALRIERATDGAVPVQAWAIEEAAE